MKAALASLAAAVQHGWPSFAMVGEDGGKAAWLLARHADQDPAMSKNICAQPHTAYHQPNDPRRTVPVPKH